MLTADQLARRCLSCIEAKDPDSLGLLFHERGRWEIAYPLAGVEGDARIVHACDLPKFHRIMGSISTTVSFAIEQIDSVSDSLAYVVFRSNVVMNDGQPYANYYVVRVLAESGKILHWLEFYDPRPAEMVRTAFSGARRRRAP